jgi:hypothetical protein
MARWTGFKLRLKNGRNLFIITAYRVCSQTSSSIGPETAYNQQKLNLALAGLINPDPRKQFQTNLITCIKKLQTPMDDVLVAMDANEALDESSHGIMYLMRECKLIHIFHQYHGVCPAFATYDKENKRLD